MLNLLKYLVFIILFLLSPLGWLYVVSGVAAICGSTHGFNVMYSLDVMVASFVFGTRYRTISGITGERYEQGRKGYRLQAKFIDKLAVLFGDKEDHCLRAWYWERDNGIK